MTQLVCEVLTDQVAMLLSRVRTRTRRDLEAEVSEPKENKDMKQAGRSEARVECAGDEMQ